jgi:hypothetical protein
MYKSPIDMLIADIQHQIAEQQDEEIYKAVVSVGINVDKDELLRALQYDRGQYKKGYADAKAELVRCCDCQNCTAYQQFADSEVILFCEKWKGHPKVDPTDFCSYGERRNE